MIVAHARALGVAGMLLFTRRLVINVFERGWINMAKKARQSAEQIEAKAEASEAAAMIGVVAAGTPRAALTPGYQRIAVARIAFDGNNHRSSTSVGKDSIEALAKGIASTGLLHPIGVVDDPEHDRVIVAYGERRLRAVMLNGDTEIDAKIYPAGTPIEAVRASENIDRTNLTPIEEALATGRVIEECGNDVDQAATRLGKDPKWVRDRQFILRLSGDARKLVQDGYLPLHYARLIAMVADPKRRDDLAERAVGSWALQEQTPGVGLERFEKVKQWVTDSMHSLAVVPWRTDVPFGGGPACNSCPSNSANEPKLFETDPENAPDKATCMDTGCFRRKQTAADQAVNAGLDRLRKKADAAEKDKVELVVTPTGLADLAPKGIKESTFVRKAQQLVNPAKAAEDDKRATKATPKQTPEQKARQEFDQAVGDWTRKGNERLVNELKKEPEKLAALALCDVHEAFDKLANSYGEANQRKALANPAWRKLLTEAGKAKGPFLKLAGAGLLNHWFDCIHQVCTQHPDVLVEVAKAFEVEMPPMPRIEEYMPKVDEPKAAAKVHGKSDAKGNGNAKPVKSAKKPAGKKVKKAASKKPAKKKAGAK